MEGPGADPNVVDIFQIREELSIYTPMIFVGRHKIGSSVGRCNDPMRTIDEFRLENFDFGVDRSIDGHLLISAASGGFLKRISEQRHMVKAMTEG